MQLDDMTTLISLGTSTTDTFSDGNGNISSNTVKSLLTTSVTTATTSIVPDVNVKLDATRDYVASMSVQEIDQMLIELDEYEQSLIDDTAEPVKVKTIGSKNKL